MDDREILLTGGNVASLVVRVGDTVRKPVTAATESVEAFLLHLEAAGFTHAPRTLGRDGQGRHVLEYIPGATVAMSQPLSLAELRRVGGMIRELHAAAALFVPPASAKWQVAIRPDAEVLICHHDLAPWNLVRDGERWVFIDWDGSGPGSPLWDLAFAAQAFVPLVKGGDPEMDAVRLRAFVDGYALGDEDRRRLPALMVKRAKAMVELLEDGARARKQPWARMHAEGHAEYWRDVVEYLAK